MSEIEIIGKLVRDGIPDIIRANGKDPHVRVLTGEEYIHELKRKLVEEAIEAREASSRHLVAELADVLTVVEAIRDACHIPELQLVWELERRRKERGGFRGCIFLESIG